MIKENSIASEYPIRLSVVHYLPVCRSLGYAIGTLMPEGGFLVAPRTAHIAKALTRTSVVEFALRTPVPDALQQIQRPKRDAMHGLHRLLKRKRNRTLSRQIVNLVRLSSIERCQ